MEIWEEYLIYSIMFDQNLKIKKDLYNKYVEEE